MQIRLGRTALGLGIRELARLADMSPNTIARIERGEDAKLSTIERIQRVLEKAGMEFPDERTVRYPESRKVGGREDALS